MMPTLADLAGRPPRSLMDSHLPRRYLGKPRHSNSIHTSIGSSKNKVANKRS